MTNPTTHTIEQTIDRIWETLLPFWQRLRSTIRSYAAENFNLTVEQFHILRLLQHGRRSVSELAAEKRISRPAISQAVEALVQRGLLTRIPDARDRRCNQLELTPEGQALMGAINQHARLWIASHLQGHSQEDLAVIIQGLGTLQSAFEDRNA
jgi:DNA-binding MarR family transcriptional regulator